MVYLIIYFFKYVYLDLAGVYHEAEFSPKYGHIYVTTIINISVAYAFYVLAVFFYALKRKLTPYDPVPKFLCIKLVIFFAFWQVRCLAMNIYFVIIVKGF